jgi:hypothetical protein
MSELIGIRIDRAEKIFILYQNSFWTLFNYSVVNRQKLCSAGKCKRLEFYSGGVSCETAFAQSHVVSNQLQMVWSHEIDQSFASRNLKVVFDVASLFMRKKS